jgi:molybdopterin converting factor small subunit
MQVNVILFGQFKELAGNDNLLFQNVPDTGHLLAAMQEKYPAMAGKKFIIAVDKKVVSKNTVLKNNSTVAVMPPFSGG